MSDHARQMCNAAIELAELGLLVLPIWWIEQGKCGCGKADCQHPGKHPWAPGARHGLHDATKETQAICSWFANGHAPNIAIRTGKGSGILVLDVDPRHGGDESLKELGAFPPTAEAQTGGGGLHLYFRFPSGVIIRNSAGKLAPGLDVRGENGYVLCPPSQHISGGEYQWVRKLGESISELPASLLDRLTERDNESDRETERQRDRDMASVSLSSGALSVKSGGVLSVKPDVFDTELRRAIDKAIEESLPKRAGQRNDAVFSLCRSLQAIPELQGLPASDPRFRAIVEQWHTKAFSIIATKPFDATWADFCHGWPRVRWPKGSDPPAIALERAIQNPDYPPEVAAYEDPATRLLVRICRQLQDMHGDQPFYLSWHAAGKLIKLSHPQAGKRLEMLMVDGILAIHTGNTKWLATRYKYLGKEDKMHPEPNPPQHNTTSEHEHSPDPDEQAEAAAVIGEERGFTADGEPARPVWEEG